MLKKVVFHLERSFTHKLTHSLYVKSIRISFASKGKLDEFLFRQDISKYKYHY